MLTVIGSHLDTSTNTIEDGTVVVVNENPGVVFGGKVYINRIAWLATGRKITKNMHIMTDLSIPLKHHACIRLNLGIDPLQFRFCLFSV
jgi:hypothetical protein